MNRHAAPDARPCLQRLWVALLVLLVLAACQPGETTPTIEAPRMAARQLATVFISPTPDEAQRRATQQALGPTPTSAPPTAIPSPTAYVGVFLGELQPDEGVDFLANPALLGSLTATAAPGFSLECEIAPNEAFGTSWEQGPNLVLRMGCPIQIMGAFDGHIQVFERGVMYRRLETGEIWAIQPGGADVGRYWYVAQAPELTTGEFVAPEGFLVPAGAFGGVWKGVPGVRDALGFAQTDERRIGMTLQRFDGGSLMLDRESGTTFALLVNGDAYGPYS